MKKNNLIKIVSVVVLLALFLGEYTTVAGRSNFQTYSSTLNTAAQPTTLFMPVVMRNFPINSLFGLGVATELNNTEVSNSFREGGSWIRGPRLSWAEIEPVQGQRHWDKLAGVQQFLSDAHKNGFTPMITVTDTPAWAQKLSYACGPMTQDKFAAFGDFMADLVSILKQPPYNQKYWEIWNEPDVAGNVTWGIGCWGDTQDSYFGGGYYGQMLAVVYPKIKAADPEAKVEVGGLLLDCDPNNPPQGVADGCLSSKFFEGILAANAGQFFDGVSIHAYDYYTGDHLFANSNWGSSSSTTGPVVAAKTNYIKSLLAKYNVSNKEILSTESALICNSCTGSPAFEETKAQYLNQVYATASAIGLKANIWYSTAGWRNSGLFNGSSLLPAAYAYKFALSQIAESVYTGTVSSSEIGATSVRGYKFKNGGQNIWLLWSMDATYHTITLAAAPRKVYQMNAAGTFDLISPSTSMSISASPVYLLW